MKQYHVVIKRLKLRLHMDIANILAYRDCYCAYIKEIGAIPMSNGEILQ